MFEIDWQYEQAQFLGGTFHQDMGSLENALQEYFSIQSKEWLVIQYTSCRMLLDSDLNPTEKETFITQHAEIYFPSINLSPIEWLEYVATLMKKRIEGIAD